MTTLRLGVREIAELPRVLASSHPKLGGTPWRNEWIAVAKELIDAPQVGTTPLVRGPLSAVVEALDGVSVADGGVMRRVVEARDVAGTEVRRIDGFLPNDGLAGHPAYDAVSRLSFKLRLLARTPLPG